MQTVDLLINSLVLVYVTIEHTSNDYQLFR